MKKFFARITEEHDAISIGMTPCAGQLYRWLLRQAPAGMAQEMELQDFANWSATYRGGQPYSIRHIQRAFQELIDKKLVEVVRRFTGRIFRLICWHPDQDKNVADLDQNVETVTQMSQKQPSNPHDTVTAIETNKEDQQIQETIGITPNTPSVQEKASKEGELVPVVPGEVICKDTKPDIPEVPEVPLVPTVGINTASPELQVPDVPKEAMPTNQSVLGSEVEALVLDVIAPAPLSPNLAQLVSESCAETVLQAVEVTRQAKAKGTLKNPSGFLTSAIKNQWKPKATTTPTLEFAGKTNFTEWFNLARDKGLVVAASIINGIQHVCTNPQTLEWKPWRDMADAFTMSYLRNMEPVRPIWWPSL